MEEICIKLPEELISKAERFKLDLSRLLAEAISARAFEEELSESAILQRAMFESLVSKSKLTEEDAKELADKVDKAMHEDFKSKFPKL